MRLLTTRDRILTLTFAALLFCLSAGIAAALALDLGSNARIAEGVSVAGTPLGGMNRAEAVATLESQVVGRITRNVQVIADGEVIDFDPSEYVTADTGAMVTAAFRARSDTPILGRVAHDVLGTPIATDVPPVYTVDEDGVRRWADETALGFDRAAESATITQQGHRVTITPSVQGRSLDATELARVLVAELDKTDAASPAYRSVSAPVTLVKPKVTERVFRRAIIVDLSQRRIRLFKDGVLEKTYPCAVGTSQFPTPTGKWKVIQKRYRPTWRNPGSDWARTMPAFIAPGPGNPLGTRAINLSAPGIRFHGTENIRSVGTAASHGCMRMYRHDVEDLYDRVYVGMPVFIIP